MRTCAKSYPPFGTPKNSKTPPTPGIFQKSSFCKRTQAASDQRNTDSFPGFLRLRTPHSRVPALYPGTSQRQCAHTLPGIQGRPPGQPGKNIKTRNELNPTQENSGARGEAANPTNPAHLSVCPRSYPRGPVPQKATSANAARPPGSYAAETVPAIHGPGAIHRHDPRSQQPTWNLFRAARLLIAGRASAKIMSMSRSWLPHASGLLRTSQQSNLLRLINVSNQIKLERAAQSFHTIE
jgi:hypothetical protein